MRRSIARGERKKKKERKMNRSGVRFRLRFHCYIYMCVCVCVHERDNIDTVEPGQVHSITIIPSVPLRMHLRSAFKGTYKLRC